MFIGKWVRNIENATKRVPEMSVAHPFSPTVLTLLLRNVCLFLNQSLYYKFIPLILSYEVLLVLITINRKCLQIKIFFLVAA